MMQNISVLMSPRRPSGFTDIKKPNVSHHPVQATVMQTKSDSDVCFVYKDSRDF